MKVLLTISYGGVTQEFDVDIPDMNEDKVVLHFLEHAEIFVEVGDGADKD